MSWETPKTDWTVNPKAPEPTDFNRIEGNIDFLKSDIETKKGLIVDAMNSIDVEADISDTFEELAAAIGGIEERVTDGWNIAYRSTVWKSQPLTTAPVKVKEYRVNWNGRYNILLNVKSVAAVKYRIQIYRNNSPYGVIHELNNIGENYRNIYEVLKFNKNDTMQVYAWLADTPYSYNLEFHEVRFLIAQNLSFVTSLLE